nr:reverse transcriptase domain-containing protein [Tanacetum cinerariifolium]
MQARSSSRHVSNPSSNPTPSTNLHPKGHNRTRSKQRIKDFNLEELLQAPTEGYEDAIVVPAITADNFELNHGLLTLVQNKQFFGHDKEDPHAHLRYFNTITSTLKFPNVSNTLIKLMLFPFSLEVIDGNVYRDNIQEFISQASAVNYNQGNTSYRPPMRSNQIRPPSFPLTPPSTSFLPKVVEDEPEATKDTVNPTNNGITEDVQP